jgi:ankyrin repeat protein
MKSKENSLIEAIKKEDYKLVNELLSDVKDIKTIKDSDGNNILHLLFNHCTYKHFGEENHSQYLKSLDKLLQKDEIEVLINEVNKEGLTPLLKYPYSNYSIESSVLQQFLDKGANIEATNIQGNTLLHLMLLEDYSNINEFEMKVFDTLINHDSCKNIIDKTSKEGVTPLFLGLTLSMDISNKLIEKGGDLKTSFKFQEK